MSELIADKGKPWLDVLFQTLIDNNGTVPALYYHHPEPDMRASRGCVSRNAASTSAICGQSAEAGASRSLRPASAISRDNGIPPASGLAQATVDGLVALGYSVGEPADIGSVQAVLIDPRSGRQYGAADARREGTVIGLPR